MGAVRFGFGVMAQLIGQVRSVIRFRPAPCSLAGFLILSFSLFSGQSFAEDSLVVERVVPEIRALRVNPSAPQIDGYLNDPIWSHPDLDIVRDFTQRGPDDGAAPTESTHVAVTYDDEAIYCAFWCFDSEPQEIDRRLVRRDRHSESDLVVMRVDPYHDHLTGNEFYLSAAGVQVDSRLYNDDWSDQSWDAVWEGAVRLHPWGWTAEYRIPYHCLRFTAKEEHVWGVNFARLVNRKDEVVWWSYTPRSESGNVSRFGHLNGLSGIKPAVHLEILPYAVSNAELNEKTSGNPDGRDLFGNTGVDIKYGLSTNLTLDATINPDFGQVELDQPVLNLSVFENWFPERRPFFMEGADLFRANYSLFYSRRIGSKPGDIDDEEFAYYKDHPSATTILGAAKLTGKLPGGTSIAFLNAVTQEEKAKYVADVPILDTVKHNLAKPAGRLPRDLTREEVTAYAAALPHPDSYWTHDIFEEYIAGYDPVSRKGVIEPAANYSVLRVKQDVLSNSTIGGMLTLVSQDTYHPATTGGVDWRLVTDDNAWNCNGQAVFSRVDDEHVGFAVDLNFEKRSGKHIRGAVGIVNKDNHLQINRLGYTSRNDFREIWSWLQYRTQDDWWIIRESYNNLNFHTAWNYAGDDISRGGNFNTYIEFINRWSLGGGVTVQAEKHSDLETRGNGLWEWPVYPTFSWWASLNTDERKRVSVNINPGSGGDRGGSWWANYIGVEYRPKSNLEFSTGANYHRTFNATRWVENRDDDAIFADLDKDEVFVHLTASVMLTRNLSWQISGQGLVSTLDYRDYKRYLGGNRYARDIEPGDNDGTYSGLNSMMIVRWEYLPGSTLYFVWTRSRPEWDSAVNDLHISREFNRFFSRGASNVWLIKASYWWNI